MDPGGLSGAVPQDRHRLRRACQGQPELLRCAADGTAHRLGVPDKPHGKYLRFYLVVEGADGFKAVYSLAEVNPMTHDGTVIVADTLDGKALQTTGPLQLVASGDKHPARWVRNLSAIRVLAFK